ncbi:preprotein translocase subunit YajC [Candidatus Rhabdochlamydia porcellionis]|jgi:preprotein translocase subunit YajC|uniref:Sec translocon accessory complex subunit YajC n=1 Tax=Candidatus Rhabdochlamydia porcellionis TaxID=225148 RepID=A0ABX8Z2T8_9BACT|nr:preprotein translocase subunit YajC [Candidatus Rhabdochlamydia porcellionis]QZA59228.1 Preprotein translocase subunit [Candidatus Rhabdochlamydia porcellionis]
MNKTSKFTIPALCVTSSVFADTEATGGNSNLMQMLFMIGFAVIFFYFIIWRPDQKRRKQMEQMRSSIAKGDRVTVMGILGTIDKVEKDTVILSLYQGGKMEVLKNAITDIQPSIAKEKEIESTEVK